MVKTQIDGELINVDSLDASL